MASPEEQFPIGLVGQASIVVTREVTAGHLGSGAVAVFATPELVRLMERAAVDALKDRLDAGQQSVGVMVNINHLAATPIGAVVTAQAELVAAEGRRLTFQVSAHDGIDLIGEGSHTRAVIDLARFEARVAAKQQQMA